MSNQAVALQPLPIQPNHQSIQEAELAAAHLSRHLDRHPIPVETEIPAEAKPRWIWRVVQWKYTVDATSKWLKRAYFHYVFLPFNRFSYWAFDLLPPNGRDDTGRLCWTESQGCWPTEWQAEQEARMYPFGHAVKEPLCASLPCSTVNTEQVHPNSPREVRQMYEKKTEGTTIQVPRLDAIKVIAKLAQSDHLFQSKAT